MLFFFGTSTPLNKTEGGGRRGGSVCKEAELKSTEHSHRGRSHLSVQEIQRNEMTTSPTEEKGRHYEPEKRHQCGMIHTRLHQKCVLSRTIFLFFFFVSSARSLFKSKSTSKSRQSVHRQSCHHTWEHDRGGSSEEIIKPAMFQWNCIKAFSKVEK